MKHLTAGGTTIRELWVFLRMMYETHDSRQHFERVFKMHGKRVKCYSTHDFHQGQWPADSFTWKYPSADSLFFFIVITFFFYRRRSPWSELCKIMKALFLGWASCEIREVFFQLGCALPPTIDSCEGQFSA